MGFRAWVKRKAKQAKKDFEKVGEVLEETAKDTGKSFEELGHETEEFFTKEARNVVQKIFDTAKRDLERFAKDSVKDTKDAFTKDLPKLAEKALAGAEEAFVEKLPALIEEAALKLAREASQRSIKEALNNGADVIELLSPTKFTLIFGIELALVVQGEVTVMFSFPNPAAKLTEMRAWARKPPKGRVQIIQCIKDFGPTSIAVQLKVSGNGLAAEWDGDDKYNRIDAFLKKHGV